MKKFLLFTVIALILMNCESKTPIDTPQADNKIVIGVIDSIYSDIIKEEQKFWVHVPNSPLGGEVTEDTKYPVLYLLDGDAHFYSVTGMIKQLSTVNGNDIVPEMIVVGLLNNDRTRDLTPTNIVEVFGDSTFAKTSGGGKNFLNYIERELIPYIEKNYPASSYRTFVGHSFGGLTVVDALVDRPDLFNNYVAIDPSLWWDDQELLKRANAVMSNTTYSNKALYVGIANTMDQGMNIGVVEKDSTESTDHIRSILSFVKSTEALKDNGLHFKWKYYENDTHGSVPLITEYDALRFLFSWYSFKEMDQLFNPNSPISFEEMMNSIDLHYKNVSAHFEYETLPSESLINTLGYTSMGNKKLEMADSLFKMNIKNYPKSWNVYDSYGELLMNLNKKEESIEMYEKSIALNPDNENGKQMLLKIKQE